MRQNFFIELKIFSDIKNHIDLSPGSVLIWCWTGFHYGLWGFERYLRKSPKISKQSGSGIHGLRSASLNLYKKALTRISMVWLFERFSLSGLQIEKFKMKTYSAWCKNTSRTQVDMVFDIRKIFKIRRKNFVISAENMLSESALKFPLIKYA